MPCFVQTPRPPPRCTLFPYTTLFRSKQKNNARQIVVPRQIAMYLAKQMTEASLPEIGRQFGGKHHTTVMHSISKIDEDRKSTRLNSSHRCISYAVFCLKKKKQQENAT